MKYHTKHLNVDSVCKIQMPLQQTNAYIVYIDISIRAWKIVWTHPSRRTSNNLPQIKPCTNSTPRFVAGSGSGVPGGGETKNKSQKKIAGFFQKMKKYWSKFRSIKNTNRIDMQYVVAKLCFRTQVSCKYTHTCNQTTRQTSVMQNRIWTWTPPKKKNATSNTAIDMLLTQMPCHPGQTTLINKKTKFPQCPFHGTQVSSMFNLVFASDWYKFRHQKATLSNYSTGQHASKWSMHGPSDWRMAIWKAHIQIAGGTSMPECLQTQTKPASTPRIEEHASFSGRDLRPCHHRIGRAKSVPTWEKESISIFKLRAKSLRPRANCEKMTGKPSFGDLSRKPLGPCPCMFSNPSPLSQRCLRTSVSILWQRQAENLPKTSRLEGAAKRKSQTAQCLCTDVVQSSKLTLSSTRVYLLARVSVCAVLVWQIMTRKLSRHFSQSWPNHNIYRAEAVFFLEWKDLRWKGIFNSFWGRPKIKG